MHHQNPASARPARPDCSDCPDAWPAADGLPRDAGRRRLLRGLLGAGVGAAASPWLAPLAALAQTAPAAGDYKALVCVFLYGGNDANNLLLPGDDARWAQYRSARGNLALARDRLLPLNAPGTAIDASGAPYALHQALPGVQKLYNAGRAALVANVGPLVVPTSQAQYRAGSVPLPAALFSHADQQTAWQAGTEANDLRARSGWGARLAERLLAAGTTNRAYAALSLAGGNLWQTGEASVGGTAAAGLTPYQLSASGRFGFDFYDPAGADPLSAAIAATLAEPRSHLFEQAWLDVLGRSVQAQQALAGALSGQTALATAFPRTDLGQQLQMTARLIGARGALGLSRQVYFTSIGGFDTHGGDQLGRQQQLYTEVDGAISAFSAAMDELGLGRQVTLFTASDFGRTLQGNGAGSDHGWGSHQLVVGGAVRGGQVLGQLPELVLGGQDDTGSGRWIPTTPVCQLGAALGGWMGASAAQRAEVWPELANFSGELGLMAA
jgi:uncharacterized protein (DUF1501 family)